MTNDDERREFGPWLRELRAERGLSASEVARRLGMSWSHYQNMEKGKVGPPRSYARLRAIAELLRQPPALVYEKAGMLPDDWLRLAEEELEAKGRAVPRRGRASRRGTP